MIKKNNLYVYKRLTQQMDVYIDKNGIFNPDKSFYDFMNTLIKENFNTFRSDFKAFYDDLINDNYYYWFFLYNEDEPKKINNDKKDEIIGKNIEKVINKNEKLIKKELNETIINLVVLGKSAEFIKKQLENKINYNNYLQSRITETETTRMITETTEEANFILKLEKVWVATVDKKTRDTHKELDGQKTNDEFKSRSGATGPGPGKMSKSSENINCRCRFILDGKTVDLNRKIRIGGKNIIAPYNTYEEYKKYYKI